MRLRNIAGAATLLLALGGGVINAQDLPVVITDIDLVNPRLVNGVLRATHGTLEGTLGGAPFSTELKKFSLDLNPAHQQDGSCAILDLELAPIHLALLGLHVDTSQICLSITAFHGETLGDLLCSLAGLNLGDLLDQLLDGGGLAQVLEGVLNQILDDAVPNQGGGNGNGNGNGGGNGNVCRGQCQVLDLVLGPITLDVLGLVVNLDNCRGGPVEVCVSATRNEGLLGSLLCGLTGLQLPGLDLADIGQLIDRAQELLDAGATPGAIFTALTTLLGQLLGGL